MERITTIGLDIAKQVFQVHGVDGVGAVVRRKLRRDDVVGYFKALPPCLIGVEACATGHHWARVLMALTIGSRDAASKRVDASVGSGALSSPNDERNRRAAEHDGVATPSLK